MSPVEDFIYQYEGRQREVLLHLHHWFVEELGLDDKIRFKIPFYYGKSWVCYMNPAKEGHIELAFVRGNELSNSHGILKSNGRKQVRSIDITDVSSIPQPALDETIQEALWLDENKPYASKRTSRKSK